MQKFIISLKDKQTGRDVMSPYIVNSLDGLGNYSERVSPLGLIVIVDSIKEENNFEIFCLFKNNAFLCPCRNQTHYFINI